MKKAGEAPNISAIARQFKVKRAFVTKWVDCYQSTGGVSDGAVGRPSGLGTQKLGTVGCKRARELAQGKDGDELDTKRVKKRPAGYGRGKGVNAKEYMTVLQETLIPGAKKIFAAREPNSWVFMQDGAKPHTAKVTQKWLADNVPSYITAWPPNSPDLNPIENLWAVMAGSLAGTRFKNIDELKEGIEKAWDDIPIGTMRKLVGGMHRRMRKVIQEDGRRISA